MFDISKIPSDAVGLRLCKQQGDDDVRYCEDVIFTKGKSAVITTLRRAAISGEVGPIGDVGPFWADFLNSDRDWTETILLDRRAWNALKNKWMRCKVVK